MEERVTLAGLTDEMLHGPDDISAVDPRVPAFRLEIDSRRCAAHVVADGEAVPVFPPPSELLIEVDSSDEKQLRRLQERVKRVRDEEAV